MGGMMSGRLQFWLILAPVIQTEIYYHSIY